MLGGVAARRIAALRRLARTLRRALGRLPGPVAARTLLLPSLAALAVLDRLGTDARIGLEAGQHDLLDRLLQQAFDVAQQAMLVDAHQRHGVARAAGAAGAADAVHVVLRHVWQLEVHHVRQLVDVEAARGDVGGDQHVELHALEVGQRPRARALALVAVDGGGADVGLVELLGQRVGAVLGAHEDQHLVPVVVVDQLDQQVALLRLVDVVDALGDQVGGGIARRHLDQLRVAQQAVGEAADLVGEGGGEEQGLLLLRHQREHFFDVVDEAHVEHAVGFVQHEDLDARQVDGALADVVEQTARRRHQDVDAALQRLDLRADADAAEDQRGFQRQEMAVGAHAFLDLGGQFARRCQHQNARLAAGGGRLRAEQLQNGQGEAGGLAGAGLGGGHQVAAGKDDGNRLRLDRRRLGIAFFGNGAKNLGAQAEFGKAHDVCPGSASPCRRSVWAGSRWGDENAN